MNNFNLTVKPHIFYAVMAARIPVLGRYPVLPCEICDNHKII